MVALRQPTGTEVQRHDNLQGERATLKTDRTEFFSDAVFAIAITLLILEIRVPDQGPLGSALLALWPSYVAYVISFLVIGTIWINHHLMFEKIAHADSSLMALNLLMLMAVAFLPFPTAVLAEAFHKGEGENIAAAFYGGTLTIAGLFVNLTWHHAARNRLLDPNLTDQQIRQIGRRYLLGPLTYALAAVVGSVVPALAVAIYGLLNIFYLWPRSPPSGNSVTEAAASH
jgi:uncharacterized membrane protein